MRSVRCFSSLPNAHLLGVGVYLYIIAVFDSLEGVLLKAVDHRGADHDGGGYDDRFGYVDYYRLSLIHI